MRKSLRWWASFEDHFYPLFVADSPRAYRLGATALALMVAAAGGLLLLTGASHQRLFPWDSTALLDGGWRLMLGQKPHLDFYDHMGITSYFTVLTGMFLVGADSRALAYGVAVWLPVITLVAWGITRRRFPAFPATCLAAMAGCLVVGTYPLGWNGPINPCYAMQYNRLHWSLLCILSLAVLMPPRQAPKAGGQWFEGAVVGMVMGLLLLGKTNYAAMAILILGAGAISCRRGRYYWSGLFVVVLACIALYVWYIRGNVAGYWHDRAILSGVNPPTTLAWYALRVLAGSARELSIPCLIILLLFPRIIVGRRSRSLLIALFLLAVGWLVTTSNTQDFDIPLWAVASMILVESSRGRAGTSARFGQKPGRQQPPKAERIRAYLSYLIATAMVLSFVAADFGSVAYSFYWKKVKGPHVPPGSRFATRSLADMLCPPPSGSKPEDVDRLRRQAGMAALIDAAFTPFEYAVQINDGIELLRGHVDRQSRILTMGCGNPFPFALELPLPRGTPLAWHPGRLMDDDHHPSAEVVFQEATHVMVPRRTLGTTQTAGFLERAYGAYFREYFVRAADSAMWTLYVRKPTAAKASEGPPR
jgi:hypothetical protein